MDMRTREPVVELIYISQAAGRLTKGELVNLLHAARAWNEENKVTGILFYKDGYFGQVLEGSYDSIALASRRIKDDKRHFFIQQLDSRPIPQRLNPNSPLKFYGDSGLSRKFPKLSEALTTKRSDKENLLRLLRLASVGL
jgi:hypothetical protein